MNRLSICLAIIAAGLVLLLIHGSSGKILGLKSDDFARVVYILPILGVMAYGIMSSRKNWRPALQMLLVWCVLILGVSSLYVYQSELTGVAKRVASGILPGRFAVTSEKNGNATLTISKNIQGHFATFGVVNGHSIQFMIDTGASDVALSYEDAVALGLHPEKLNFNRVVSTANGDTVSAPVSIDSLQIGPLIRNNIRASVALQGRLDQSLLGMSYLSTLSGVEITPNQLTLSD